MNTALLHDGRMITASEYNFKYHGTRLYCVDKNCHVPVIFVPGTESVTPYFKTTGKNNSKHKPSCAFFKPLSFEESIVKVAEFQEDYLNHKGFKKNVIRLNLNKLDPDFESKTREIEKKKENPVNPNEIKTKQESTTPKSITSLKSIVKLINSYEPDVLATILIQVKGNKIPLSQVILSPDKAHELLWNNQIIDSFSYLVYGTVDHVNRRKKVYYINLKPVNNVLFSLVVFDKYFKHFTYTNEQLIGKSILAWGILRCNTYQNKNTSEMLIKSNQYLEFL
ncbi:hypothetical protein NSQ82_20550 [Caldifermentibacillus hisashii]|uniref:hypothetical protein n=1 Tax=Caldifermentibacillus hisashii TaxID=996558 RepID=UPI0031B7153E